MNKTVGLALVVGVLAIAAYFVVSSVGASTDQADSVCAGDWTDYVNPLCWGAKISDLANTITNEGNTILIIVAVVIIAVVGLLAFGTSTEHIARGAALLA